jgi:hypothetical protein
MRLIPQDDKDINYRFPPETECDDWLANPMVLMADTIKLKSKCAYTIFNDKCYLLPTTDLIIKNALTGESYYMKSLPEVKL